MACRRLTLVLSSCLATSSLAAQATQCATQSVTVRDACQKGTDVFLMLAPQINTTLAAGGPLLGTARTADGLSLTLRLNVADGAIPDFTTTPFSATGVVRSTIPTTRAPIPMPALDAALTLVPGMRAGRQRILQTDLLVSVQYVPNRALEAFRVRTTNGAFRSTFGARVGLLSESARLPAVSLSFLRRATPITTIEANIPNTLLSTTQARDSLSLAETSLRADAYRAALSKRFGFLEIGGGVGQDRYRNFTQLRTRVTPVILGAPLPPVTSAYVVTQRLTRNSAYGTLALNLGRVHVGLEAGSTFGGDSVATFNTFTSAPSRAQRYGSVGVRYSF